MSDLRIIGGTAHPKLAQGIARHLNRQLTNITIKSFPGGETHVQIDDNIRGSDVFLIQPTGPPANENLMELLITIDAARRASAGRITAVIPFFGYARQDRKDKPRVPITAKLVANILVAAGVNRIIAVDLHAAQIAGFFDIPVDHLTALPVIYRHLQLNPIKNLVVVSPDIGGVKNASAYAKELGCDFAIVSKERTDATTTRAIAPLVGRVRGKNALLIDDMTETAGTLETATSVLLKQGALTVRAAISHAVFNRFAVGKLAKSRLTEIITTNTTNVKVPRGVTVPVTVLDMSTLLAEAISRVHNNESVTKLFQV